MGGEYNVQRISIKEWKTAQCIPEIEKEEDKKNSRDNDENSIWVKNTLKIVKTKT